MIDYGKQTPETDAFMAKINGDEIDLEMVRAKFHDMERQRDSAIEALAKLDSLYRADQDEPDQRPDWIQEILDLSKPNLSCGCIA